MRRCFVLVAFFAVVVISGCSTAEMKGTPFYTGEFSGSTHAEDRVNLWPLAYYNDPALSILWPIGESTDDHFAIRPLFSVYGLDKKQHQYNVLWPLAHFDRGNDEHRIFPFFWGDLRANPYFVIFPLVWYEPNDFFTLFPIYWHSPNDYTVIFPFFWHEPGGHKVLFPIFWYEPNDYTVLFPVFWHKPKGHTIVFPVFWYSPKKYSAAFPFYIYRNQAKDFHLLWPFYNKRSAAGREGWRIWPFYGDYNNGDQRYRFAAWPLVHSMRKPEESWDVAFPLFFRRQNDNGHYFASLLYNSADDKKGNWRLAFPFFFQTETPDQRLFMTPLFGRRQTKNEDQTIVTPLLSSYTKADDYKELWYLAPFGRVRWGEGAKSHLFPFYAYDSEKKLFLSLPYSSERKANGEVTRAILGPVVFWNVGPNSYKWLALLLIGGNRNASAHGWHVFPFITDYTAEGYNHFLPWPLVRSWKEPNEEGFRIWPLYYQKAESLTIPASKLNPIPTTGTESELNILTLLYRWKKEGDRTNWFAPWPLAFGWDRPDSIETRNRGFWILPLYGRNSVVAGEKTLNSDLHLLGWLYDRKYNAANDYVRSRVLWRVMHYEREGTQTSLDVFPWITVDKKPDEGFKKVSFAWRLFRYERGKDGTKLDLLFIPLRR